MNTKPYTLAALLLGSGLLVACGTEAGKETERVNDQLQDNRENLAEADDTREWMKEREEASEELAELRENMVDRLERERKRLGDGIKDVEKRAETERHVIELEQNITRIDVNMRDLDNASQNTWRDVQTMSRKATDDTRNWWDRQKDWIDAETKADNDNDGK
jgi:chromosome segregation ATPase